MSENQTPDIPLNQRYATTHEWARLVPDGILVGITAFAVEEMGRDIVHIELPTVRQRVTAKETFGVIDSVKAAFDLYAPVSGEIVDVNTRLMEDPSLIGQSPYDKGWMIQIKATAMEEFDALLGADAYKAMLQSGEKAP